MGSSVTKMRHTLKAAQDAAGYLMADILMNDRKYLGEGEQAPEGTQEQQGERGGRYYEGGGKKPTDMHTSSESDEQRRQAALYGPKQGTAADKLTPERRAKLARRRQRHEETQGRDAKAIGIDRPQRIPKNAGDMTPGDKKAMGRAAWIAVDEDVEDWDLDDEAYKVAEQAKERGDMELSDPTYVRQLLLIHARRQQRKHAKWRRGFPEVYYD